MKRFTVTDFMALSTGDAEEDWCKFCHLRQGLS